MVRNISIEELAALILKSDSTASNWVYNRYCGCCAKYLYPEELEQGCCKKCKAGVDISIDRPIPFSSSGTAIEKLLLWARSHISKLSLDILVVIYGEFLDGNIDLQTYRQRVINIVAKSLLAVRE